MNEEGFEELSKNLSLVRLKQLQDALYLLVDLGIDHISYTAECSVALQEEIQRLEKNEERLKKEVFVAEVTSRLCGFSV